MLPLLSRALFSPQRHIHMSNPASKAFGLALIQLGQVTSSKEQNLTHARDMILKAAHGDGGHTKPRVIVLPVCADVFLLYFKE